MWDAPLAPIKAPIQSPPPIYLNEIQVYYIIQKDKTKLELAQYLNANTFSPPSITFQTSIRKGNFISWPTVDDINPKEILPTTLETVKGCLQ